MALLRHYILIKLCHTIYKSSSNLAGKTKCGQWRGGGGSRVAIEVKQQLNEEKKKSKNIMYCYVACCSCIIWWSRALLNIHIYKTHYYIFFKKKKKSCPLCSHCPIPYQMNVMSKVGSSCGMKLFFYFMQWHLSVGGQRERNYVQIKWGLFFFFFFWLI